MQQMKVAPVEGRMVLDPRTIGSAQHHRIGHTRKIDGEKVVLGRKEPRVRFAFDEKVEHVLVTETADGYFRRAILDGDLDYIEHVELERKLTPGKNADGKDDEQLPKVEVLAPTRKWRDVELVRATARNKNAREKAADLAEKEAAKADAEHALALDAAERGEDA